MKKCGLCHFKVPDEAIICGYCQAKFVKYYEGGIIEGITMGGVLWFLGGLLWGHGIAILCGIAGLLWGLIIGVEKEMSVK